MTFMGMKYLLIDFSFFPKSKKYAMRYFVLLMIMLQAFGHVIAQDGYNGNNVKNKITVGFGSTLNNSRYYEGNQNNSLYKELTIEYGIDRFINAGVYVGHQKRTYSFLSAPPEAASQIYNYTQTFIPVGLRLTFQLTPFVMDRLDVNLNLEKLDFYITYLAGATFNSVENQFSKNSNPNNIIDYTDYRTDEDINFHAGLLTGVRFKPFKNFGVFLEGGLGTIGNVNLGLFKTFN